jgi:DNA (cytosine-5)-methyltransferase 1
MPSSNHHLHELALFAGAGGGILGGKLLGWKCVCAVEFEPAAQRMLAARQDDGCLDPFPIWDDVRTFDGKPWRGLVDVVSGGFPCQDISAAGKGAGLSGERSGLWSEMSRIIGEVGPRYVLVENSPVLTSRGLGTVLGDLAAMGYDARWGVLGAVHAGAPHKRERIWIVAHSDRAGREERDHAAEPAGTRQHPRLSAPHHVADASRIQPGRADQRPERERAGPGGESIALADADRLRELQPQGGEQEQRRRTGDCGSDVGHVAGIGRNEAPTPDSASGEGLPRETGGPSGPTRGTWWESEPDVGRVAHGVAARVDRLRALGNGQVPAVVALAWKLLKR